MPVKTSIQVRRDTAANWTSTNPTLASGEQGLETDTRKVKFGDGTTVWTSLAYAGSAGDVTLNGVETLTNKTLTSPVLGGQAREKFYTTATGFAGYTFYFTTNGAIQYSTANATASGTVNITSASGVTLNSILAVNEAITCVLQITNGTTAYYPTAWQIDGTSVTPKWIGGTAPTAGNVSAMDIYTVTIQKTASATYTVIASQVKVA